MAANTHYLELMSILLNIFQPQKFMSKTIKLENLFLKRKDKRYQKKKLGCKFIRINTSDAERGYDIDYEISKIQTFISKFEDRQLKNQKKNQTKKIKEKENKIKELEDEIKNLKF